VRLPGSGGACEIAINARRLIYIMRLSRRAFVPTLDFRTSPGRLEGGDSRAATGMPGEGPVAVITDHAVFDFDNPEREMQLSGLHPGTTVEMVRAEVGWELRVSRNLRDTPPPTEEELDLLRTELDPDSHYR
jgi:glutaconate CoA-transferase subunit B